MRPELKSALIRCHKRPIPTKRAHFKKYGAAGRFIIGTIDQEAAFEKATHNANDCPFARCARPWACSSTNAAHDLRIPRDSPGASSQRG